MDKRLLLTPQNFDETNVSWLLEISDQPKNTDIKRFLTELAERFQNPQLLQEVFTDSAKLEAMLCLHYLSLKTRDQIIEMGSNAPNNAQVCLDQPQEFIPIMLPLFQERQSSLRDIRTAIKNEARYFVHLIEFFENNCQQNKAIASNILEAFHGNILHAKEFASHFNNIEIANDFAHLLKQIPNYQGDHSNICNFAHCCQNDRRVSRWFLEQHHWNLANAMEYASRQQGTTVPNLVKAFNAQHSSVYSIPAPKNRGTNKLHSLPKDWDQEASEWFGELVDATIDNDLERDLSFAEASKDILRNLQQTLPEDIFKDSETFEAMLCLLYLKELCKNKHPSFMEELDNNASMKYYWDHPEVLVPIMRDLFSGTEHDANQMRATTMDDSNYFLHLIDFVANKCEGNIETATKALQAECGYVLIASFGALPVNLKKQ